MSLKKIKAKILSEKRLTSDDAVTLFNSDDIFTIGRLASHVALKKNGNNVFFIQNHHINPTNICVNRCKFCAFSRSKGDKGAYELSIKEIIKKLRTPRKAPEKIHIGTGSPRRKAALRPRRFTRGRQSSSKSYASEQAEPKTRGPSFSEVHIVGGLHPDWQFDFYLEMLRQIKKSFPHIHIKAFTAVEIDYFSKISGLDIVETLGELRKAGLDSMPGGGAEIFDSRVRNRICPEKISGRRWLEVMETAHKAGIKSNATMLYGHHETYKHRIEHMNKLRELQDRTGGFQAFIPLSFHPENTRLSETGSWSPLTGHYGSSDDLKTIAIARLFLDNFPHIKAYWIMLGEKIAQLALLFGADDLDGTVIEEKITHSAGALSEIAMTKSQLINLIKKAGRTPVERDSFYRPV